MRMSISVAGAILGYLELTKHDTINHITGISRIDQSSHLLLDKFTLRNLEIIHPTFEGGSSLASTIDKCETSMGARMLRRWLAMPLKSPEEIQKRQDIVTDLLTGEELLDLCSDYLKEVGDLERLVAKIGVGRISPREMNQLKTSLATIPYIMEFCSKSGDNLKNFAQHLNPCTELVESIGKSLNPDAPAMLNKGNVIASGVCQELDELRQLSLHGKDLLVQMQQREIEATGIPTLKIGFNNVFGYYIEVSKSYKDKTPENWIRKQTLVNGERYITPELKEYEEKIMGAEERIAELESDIYSTLLAEAGAYIKHIQIDAHYLATLDVLYSFAKSSKLYNYSKPVVDDSDIIDIKEGRHPVIEQILPVGEEYISNNLFLNQTDQQIIIITV
jgi:DNA mismatch repair protein MutS